MAKRKDDQPKQHRVWIELDPPRTNEEGEARAKLLSSMLKRLGADYGRHPAVWWNEHKRCYCFTSSSIGGFWEATDNGHWYNLEYFGRED